MSLIPHSPAGCGNKCQRIWDPFPPWESEAAARSTERTVPASHRYQSLPAPEWLPLPPIRRNTAPEGVFLHQPALHLPHGGRKQGRREQNQPFSLQILRRNRFSARKPVPLFTDADDPDLLHFLIDRRYFDGFSLPKTDDRIHIPFLQLPVKMSGRGHLKPGMQIRVKLRKLLQDI